MFYGRIFFVAELMNNINSEDFNEVRFSLIEKNG